VKRGELYLVQHPSSRDPRRQRVFVIVSRQLLVNSSFSSVICAPVYTRRDGLHTQIDIGIEEGMKHESSIHCDELMSLSKSSLTTFIGSLSPAITLACGIAPLAYAVPFQRGFAPDMKAGGPLLEHEQARVDSNPAAGGTVSGRLTFGPWGGIIPP